MPAVVDKDKCTGCGECKSACPCDAIEIVDGKAQVNDDCAGCGVCADTCPSGAITIE
ncbi:MAG: 4Fe-4S binding protein [Planctomycetia bacterium]|nr:4Fe-4S binding protein [Planctomycetia bacterium]